MRRLLVSWISTPRLASLSEKNAYHCNQCSHLTSFCSFNHYFISPHVITRGCIDKFNWTGFSRQIDTTYRLIYFKTLVYTKTCVVTPSFLFPVGTVTGVIVTLFLLLSLTSFLSLNIGLKHDLHEGHTFIAPKLLVGLLGLRGLTCCCREGLTIAIVAMAVQGVVGLLGAAMGFATLAKLLTASLLRDSFTQAPRCFPLGAALGIWTGCCSLTLCLELLILLLNHDHSIASRSGNNACIDSRNVRWVRLYWFCHIIGTEASIIVARSA